jgi:hypothetical protein
VENQKQTPSASGSHSGTDSPPVCTVQDPRDRAFELYVEHLKQAWADCQSGSDEFDKSILTYSSAGLGISLAFIKDIVPLANAVWLPLLYTSWIAFGVAILITVFSFQLSVKAQEKHLEHLCKYYLEGKPEYLNAQNAAALWVGRFKWISGSCFVVAIAATIVFSVWNVKEARHMSENDTESRQVQEGRKPLNMTPLEKGRLPMGMTPLPSSTSPVPPNTVPQPSPNDSASQPSSASPKENK